MTTNRFSLGGLDNAWPGYAFNGYISDFGIFHSVISPASLAVLPSVSSTPSDVYAVVMADSFMAASDARLKSNIVSLEGALGKIDGIRGVYHNWVDPSQPQERQIGLIAQELQAVYPELVMEGGNGYLSVNYPKLTAVLLQSVKELKARVLALMKQ